jgi:hypothetical protein
VCVGACVCARFFSSCVVHVFVCSCVHVFTFACKACRLIKARHGRKQASHTCLCAVRARAQHALRTGVPSLPPLAPPPRLQGAAGDGRSEGRTLRRGSQWAQTMSRSSRRFGMEMASFLRSNTWRCTYLTGIGCVVMCVCARVCVRACACALMRQQQLPVCGGLVACAPAAALGVVRAAPTPTTTQARAQPPDARCAARSHVARCVPTPAHPHPHTNAHTHAHAATTTPVAAALATSSPPTTRSTTSWAARRARWRLCPTRALTRCSGCTTAWWTACCGCTRTTAGCGAAQVRASATACVAVAGPLVLAR